MECSDPAAEHFDASGIRQKEQKSNSLLVMVYLEATYLWWGEAANNPMSGVYGGRMITSAECAAWTWDARPYPFFPALTDVWTDGDELAARALAERTARRGVARRRWCAHLCRRAGLPDAQIDVSGLWGAVEGYVITALESPRASITTLSRQFGFDAVESEGVIRFSHARPGLRRHPRARRSGRRPATATCWN